METVFTEQGTDRRACPHGGFARDFAGTSVLWARQHNVSDRPGARRQSA
jgi:hypothetical protein